MTDAELTAAIREVRDRARANVPEGALGPEGVVAPDLLPLVHARDAAEAKVAAIGTVNPRPPGLKNSLAQGFKRFLARVLDWHVREQVEFNRASMVSTQATLEAMTTLTRSLGALAAHHQALHQAVHQNVRLAELEQRAVAAEIRVLRTISELQGAYQLRVDRLEDSYQQVAREQARDFQAALDRSAQEIQQRLWADLKQVQDAADRSAAELQQRMWEALDRQGSEVQKNIAQVQQQAWTDLKNVRQEFERLMHFELRLLRQKSVVIPAGMPGVSPAATAAIAGAGHRTAGVGGAMPIDWQAFAERFRGSEERVRGQQARYVARFQDTNGEILDLGCGRGEFLEAARDAGLQARGVERSEECVEVCRAKGLEAECADLFAYLEARADQSVAGVRCSQVVEHLPPAAVAQFVALLGRKMQPGALVAIETPNPECLAIFATHFYIDPTHTRPVPAAVLRFYLEEAGFGEIDVEYLEPAVESFPAIQELPAGVRELFFGGLDYVVFARKL